MEILTRREAKERGMKHYYTGKLCPNGHDAPRWTSVGTCVTCSRIKCDAWRVTGRAAEWREANREHIIAQQQGYRDARKAQRALQAKEYYAEHKEERAAYQRQYLEDNRTEVYARLHKRRARKLSATPGWYSELDDFVLQQAAQLCELRKTMTGQPWHIDHMFPLQARNVCGLHWHANIQVIPQRLNAAKSNRVWLTQPGEWIRHV